MSQSPKAVTSMHHIRSLDGLRGTAFLSVFLFHYGMTAHTDARWVLIARQITGCGWVGVDLFFVLSGFLITGILLDTREEAKYFRNFHARRALRIFPLFYGVLFLLLALTPLLHLQWRPGHFAQFVYFGNLANHIDPTLNVLPPYVNLVHFWSLAVEEQFYMVWPLVILWVADRGKLLRICVGMMAGSFVLRALLLWATHGRATEWCYGELPTHCDGLLAGAIAAILFRSTELSVLVRRTRIPLFVSLAGILILAFLDGGLNYHAVAPTLFLYPLLAMLFACVLFRTIQSGTVFCWLGRTRVLHFFGKYSYGMYVYHLLFSPVVGLLLAPCQRIFHSRSAGGLVYVLLTLALTCGVSVLSFNLYEKRWLKLKSYFNYTEPVEVPVAAAAS